MRLVDHMGDEEAPDAPVPFFIRRVGLDGAERSGGADALGAGPPIAIRLIRPVAPVERVVEAAKLPVPADRCRLAEQLCRGFDHPCLTAASELPELDKQAAPFERMAGGRAARAEHRIALIVPVDLPILGEMFGDPPALVAGVAIDDQGRDALRLVEIATLARRLEGRHQRFGEMHVGVLAAISSHRRPIGIVFFRGRAGRLVPESVLDHLRHVGKQTRRVGMPHAHRRRGGEQDEGMAVSLLRRVGGFLVIHAPEIAAVLSVAHSLPQERHAMVDDAVGAWKPEQMRDGEAMHHARCVVHPPVRAFVSGLRRERPRVLIQREEAARRIEGGKLEEVEEGAGVVDEPQPVRRQRREARRPGYGKVLDRGVRHHAPRRTNEDGESTGAAPA